MIRIALAVVLLTVASAATAQVMPLTTWYWQLRGTIDASRPATIYDIDMADNEAALFAQLKSAGHIVICYFSAGTWEEWRSDAADFPASVKGAKVTGWAGENWLDIRSPIVRDLMSRRMDLAESKGCDGLEPDNVDGYANKSGFPLTRADQIAYDRFLADAAHRRGMLVALKNAADLVATLAPAFDFAVVEECFKFNECAAYSPFIKLGKAVLAAEYSAYSESECVQARALGFSLAFYGLNLNGRKYAPCL